MIQIFSKIIEPISIANYPTLPCPFCDNTELKIDKETFNEKEMSVKKRREIFKEIGLEHEDLIKENFQDEGILSKILATGLLISSLKTSINTQYYIFNTFLTCDKCNESVSASGYSLKNNDLTKIKINHFSTPIPMFKLEKAVPKSVKIEILQAFYYFHSDILASGHKIRRAIENICSELGFNNYKLYKNIKEFKIKYPNEGLLLENINKLGNEATHSNNIDPEDIITSFECLEHVLIIFVNNIKEKELSSKALLIGKKY